jgi:hypothetical protein
VAEVQHAVVQPVKGHEEGAGNPFTQQDGTDNMVAFREAVVEGEVNRSCGKGGLSLKMVLHLLVGDKGIVFL